MDKKQIGGINYKNPKGFTLIELLAVIVILAVIALIVTPIVTGIISNAKDSANARSVEGHIKNIEYQLLQQGFKDGNGNMATGTYASFSDFNFTDYPINDNVRCTNYVVSKGTVLSATNCSATGFAKEYYYVQGENAKAYGENTENNETVVTTLYANGDVVYFNPETGMKCDESEAVSTTGTRGGCMKWYTFNDSEGATSVNMILDHNTTSTCTFEGLVSHLIGDTTTWKSNLNARNITANEVAQIVGHTTWNSNTAGTSNWFYLDSLDQTQTKNATNPSSYAWLFNNLYQSKTYGGTEEDNNAYNYSYYNSTSNGSTAVTTTYAYGYWTANDVATDSARAWLVYRGGFLGNDNISYARSFGVRPVITVSKSIIS